MPMSPEMAVGATQDAPPDRPTANLEQLLTQATMIIGRDGGIDQNEKQIVRRFVEQLSMMAQGGQLGGPGAPGAGGAQALPPSPGEMNMNTQDMGTVEGAQPEYEGAY